MSVYSAAILSGKRVIAYYGDDSYEKEINRLIPEDGVKNDQKITGTTIFSFYSTPGLVYACVTSNLIDKQKPLILLETISRRWAATYGPQSVKAAYRSFDKDFISSFGSLFADFGKPSKTEIINQQLNETQDVLSQAMKKAINRSGELETMSIKSESVLSASEEFNDQANALRNKMMCSYYKSLGLKIVIILIFLYLILKWICGGWDLKPRCL